MRFWERPKKEFVREIEFNEKGNPVTRIRIRLFIEKGKLKNYTVQLEHILEKKWKEVVRFNCFHGFVHKDIYNKRGKQIDKIDLGTFTSLNEAVLLAIKDINEKYKDYIRKFRGE